MLLLRFGYDVVNDRRGSLVVHAQNDGVRGQVHLSARLVAQNLRSLLQAVFHVVESPSRVTLELAVFGMPLPMALKALALRRHAGSPFTMSERMQTAVRLPRLFAPM